MNIRQIFLSLRGRVTRFTFVGLLLSCCTVFALLFTILTATTGRTSTWILYPPFFWALLCLFVKRLHDRGKSGFWLLLLAIPCFGPLWLLLELSLLKGTSSENKYGKNPRTTEANYMTVQ